MLCSEIWALVSIILTNDSPEGNLNNLLTEQNNLPENALRDEITQDLLSSSWRSLKEASALLGTVLTSDISAIDDYRAAGALFMQWLTRIRHRGAFSAVMPSFENLCTQCFKDEKKGLHGLPAQWLDVYPLQTFANSGLFVLNLNFISIYHAKISRVAHARYGNFSRRD